MGINSSLSKISLDPTILRNFSRGKYYHLLYEHARSRPTFYKVNRTLSTHRQYPHLKYFINTNCLITRTPRLTHTNVKHTHRGEKKKYVEVKNLPVGKEECSVPRCRISESDDSLASDKWPDYRDKANLFTDDFSFPPPSGGWPKNGEKSRRKKAVDVVDPNETSELAAQRTGSLWFITGGRYWLGLTWDSGWSWPEIRLSGAMIWSEEGSRVLNKEHWLQCCCWRPTSMAVLGETPDRGLGTGKTST